MEALGRADDTGPAGRDARLVLDEVGREQLLDDGLVTPAPAFADPEIAAEISAVLAERSERLKAVVAPLAPHLRTGLTVDTAHDLLLALSLLEVYQELRDRGWSAARYRAWLGTILRERLLRPDAAIGGVSPRR